MSIEFTEPTPTIRQPLCDGFYDQNPHELARNLLGRDLVRTTDDGSTISGRILEVEVYGFDDDPASHADTGVPTDRTAPMFGEPGTAYVYQIYGIHHCLNVVAPAGERPSAVLIRALHPLDGRQRMVQRRGLNDQVSETIPRSVTKNLLSGPGKICQALHIDTAFNTSRLAEKPLQLTAGAPVVDADDLSIATGPRIGLNPDTVGSAADRPWRYAVAESTLLSRPI